MDAISPISAIPLCTSSFAMRCAGLSSAQLPDPAQTKTTGLNNSFIGQFGLESDESVANTSLFFSVWQTSKIARSQNREADRNHIVT